MKSGTDNYHATLLSISEFHENKRSEGHPLLKVTNEIFPILSSFVLYQTWVQVSTTDVHTHSMNLCFAKTGTTNATLHLKVPMYFYPNFPHLFFDMSKIEHFPFFVQHLILTVNLLLPTAGLCFRQTTTLKDHVVERGGGSGATRTMCGSPPILMHIWVQQNAVTGFYYSSICKACMAASTDICQEKQTSCEKIQNIPS